MDLSAETNEDSKELGLLRRVWRFGGEIVQRHLKLIWVESEENRKGEIFAPRAMFIRELQSSYNLNDTNGLKSKICDF